MNLKRLDRHRLFVREYLEELGAKVEVIEEGSVKTPDLKAKLGDDQYLLEVTATKRDQRIEEFLQQPKGTPMENYKTSAIQTKLRGSYGQLRDYARRHNLSDFRVIWYLTQASRRPILVSNALVKGLLFGTETLEGYTENGEFYQKTCFYFYHSFFFRRKGLDAVVSVDQEGAVLCVNGFSSRVPQLRKSSLYRLFEEHHKVIDAERMEDEGTCFIADCDYPRHDPSDINRVAHYLREKYGLKRPRIYCHYLVNHPLDE